MTLITEKDNDVKISQGIYE